jgi:hypothetical protein
MKHQVGYEDETARRMKENVEEVIARELYINPPHWEISLNFAVSSECRRSIASTNPA